MFCQDTIIILHGWQSSRQQWSEVEQKLEKSNKNIIVIIPNLPGFKKKTELSCVWDLDDYVDWFKEFSSNFNQPFFLLGHSFGGRIAIKFAELYPERLKGLILVSSAGIIPKRKFSRSIISKIANLGKIFSCFPFYKLFRKGFYKYILQTSDYIQAEKLPFLKETFKNVIKEDLRKYFNKIKIPCLIIWGDKDKLTPLSDGYLMNKQIPNSKLEILKDIGHCPYKEIPEILTQKILNFIN